MASINDPFYNPERVYCLRKRAFGKVLHRDSPIAMDFAENGWIYPTLEPDNTDITARGDLLSLGAGNNVLFVFKVTVKAAPASTLTSLDFIPYFTGRPDIGLYDLENSVSRRALGATVPLDDERQRRKILDDYFSTDLTPWRLTVPYIEQVTASPETQRVRMLKPVFRMFPDLDGIPSAPFNITYDVVIPISMQGDVIFFELSYAPSTPSGNIFTDTATTVSMVWGAFAGESSNPQMVTAPNLQLVSV